MDANKEVNIEIPIRLLKNLIDCIDAQKSLSSGNIDITSRQQIQTLIDSTKEWARSFLNSVQIKNKNSPNLQETLDFVQTDKKANISIGTCDMENESACTMIVEPDDPEGGFL
jgi:hypothetical protein